MRVDEAFEQPHAAAAAAPCLTALAERVEVAGARFDGGDDRSMFDGFAVADDQRVDNLSRSALLGYPKNKY